MSVDEEFAIREVLRKAHTESRHEVVVAFHHGNTASRGRIVRVDPHILEIAENSGGSRYIPYSSICSVILRDRR